MQCASAEQIIGIQRTSKWDPVGDNSERELSAVGRSLKEPC